MIYTPAYHLHSNGRIESFHNVLKACLSKHVSSRLEWDDVVPLACAAYNLCLMNILKKVHFLNVW